MKISQKKTHVEFPILLKAWYSGSIRNLPWKENSDPYAIWLSEIILQQTRVEQGLPYYQRFMEAFPTIFHLASASQDEVMKLWQGLGYYSRARNLHSTALHIAENLDGVFPSEYAEIRELKGVGDYTAAAIASFAFGLPYAVVDGNVYRVLSRFFGIDTPIDTTIGKKEFQQLAQSLLNKEAPADYNQAIMDFGATHCTPKNPKCESCLMSPKCFAFLNQKVDQLPVKSKKIKRRSRHFLFFVANFSHHIYIAKRTGKDIWQDLYQFPLLELDKLTGLDEEKALGAWEKLEGGEAKLLRISKTYKQILTHQTIHANFVEIQLFKKPETEKLNWIPIERKNLKNFAFPKIITCFLNDKTLYLMLD